MGCDVTCCSKYFQSDWFQSTHPHGVRRLNHMLVELLYSVSIHAPTWGATKAHITLSLDNLFQSTHPHGVRLPQLDLAHVGIDRFNPRTHMGCDFRLEVSVLTKDGFQSTHPHGVRPLVVFLCLFSMQFQSTHPHGVRPRHDIEHFGR